jgi:hypothetical protein
MLQQLEVGYMNILPMASLILAVAGLPLLYFLGRHLPRLQAPPDINETGEIAGCEVTTKPSVEPSLADRMREAAERERIAAGKPPLPKSRRVPGLNALPLKKRKADEVLSAAGPAMQILLSLTLVSAGLFMILSGHYDPNSQHWAFATIGTVVGFWLKGK